VIVGIAAFLAALVFHLVVLQRFPNSGDEFAYLWQAEAFASGSVTAETPEPQAAFAVNHIADRDGRRFAKYPPGWPLLLAVGVWAGAPGVINPLLAALALAGLYRLGCLWIGERAALLGVAVTGLSPFFLLNAGSYFSHPSCLFALTALAICLAWGDSSGRGAAYALAGTSFGLAVLIRPFSALLIGTPLVLWCGVGAWRAGRLWRATVAFGIGGLPCALFLAAVNQAVSGQWALMAWTYVDPTETVGFGPYGHTPWRGVKLTARMLAEGALYTGLLTPVLVLAARRRFGATHMLLWTLFLVHIGGHVFWWTHGGNRYGPRYYFEALLPFTLLVGVGLERVLSWPRGRAFVWAGSLVAAVALIVLSSSAWRQVYARRGLERTVAAAGLDRALVFVATASADLTRSDLARNPPDVHGARVLYAIASSPDADRRVAAMYPDRTAYRWTWAPEGGTLVRLDGIR
jgi:4-amino-4-deoxy-L-arabinose transferase-like glycosyltransferase